MFFLRLDTFIRATSFGFRQQSAPPPTRASRKSSPPCWKTGTRNPWPQNLRRTTTRKPLVSTPQPANNRGRGATRPVRTHTRRVPCVFMVCSVYSRPLKSPLLRDIVQPQYLAYFLNHVPKSFHGSSEVIGRCCQKHVHSISHHTLIKVAAQSVI